MKKILTMLMVVAVIFGLASCKKGPKDDRTEITFWHMFPVGSVPYAKVKKVIDNYNNSQDLYKVKATGFGFWDYWDKIDIAISSRTTPDIGLNTVDNVKYRANGKVLYNISDLIKADTSENNIDLNEFRETHLESSSFNGDLYAMPFSATTRVLYYNLDLFDELGLTEADVPKTWSELQTIAKMFDKVDGNGKIQRLGFDPTYGQATYHGWLWQTGEDFFDDNLNITLNTQTHKDVLQWMVDFNKEYSVVQLSTFGESNQLLGTGPFVSQRVAMIIEVDDLYLNIEDAGATFRYGVAPIPVPDEDGIRVNWGSGFSIEMYDNGKKNEAKKAGAFDFLKYVMSYETQQELSKATGWLMSHISAMEDLVANDPIKSKLLQEVDYAVERRYVPYAPQWTAGDWQPFYTRATERKDSVDKVLADARAFYQEKKDNYERTNK